MAHFEITPRQARERQRQGALLVDIRQAHERASGQAEGALGIPKDELEAEHARHLQAPDAAVMLICQSGQRSAATVQVLRAAGYTDVHSVAGGTTAWIADALPLVRPQLDADEADFLERYSRHLRLDEVGVEGQRRLERSRVLLVGAGGLGSPIGLYLAAAGIGTLTLIDDDRVERSNLQRQVVHLDERIGLPKVESARRTLAGLNPSIRVHAVQERLRASNVENLLRDHDVVVDGADNFPTRYLVNAACLQLRLPWVYGAVHRFSGQASAFDPRDAQSPCYRCLFPYPPSAAEAPNCSEAGVLGVLPGIVGLLQANEVLKFILGIGAPLVGRLLCHDALAGTFRELRLRRDADCPGCGVNASFGAYEDIEQVCSAP